MHAELADDEVGKLEAPVREPPGGVAIVLALEKEQRPVGRHARARSRRNDHGTFPRENAQRVSRHLARRFPVARIEGGLTAARLIRWDLDSAAEMLEHFDGRWCDIVEKRISEAGRHETDASPNRPRARHDAPFRWPWLSSRGHAQLP